MWKRLALWYLLRRVRSREKFYSAELARLDHSNMADELMARHMALLRANNAHAVFALESVKNMEGT